MISGIQSAQLSIGASERKLLPLAIMLNSLVMAAHNAKWPAYGKP
jgi:hypothetical protein